MLLVLWLTPCNHLPVDPSNIHLQRRSVPYEPAVDTLDYGLIHNPSKHQWNEIQNYLIDNTGRKSPSHPSPTWPKSLAEHVVEKTTT